jgi:L,D-transpeptidase ErfK/SrfK
MGWRVRSGAAAIVVLSIVASARASLDGSTAPTVVGGVATYVVGQNDTLQSVGARVGIDVAVLAEENGLRGDARLHPGQQLRVDNRHIVPDGVLPGVLVVNVPQRMLFYVGDDGRLDVFPVAIGRRSWATPTGWFTVLVKETQPTWDVPESIRREALSQGRTLPAKVPPGPSNPLGAFWIGLSIGGIGVHGTNAPASIYRAATHGCVRLHPDDIAQLFPRVRVGMPGRIVYEPVLLAVDGDAVFLEVHRDVYGRLAVASAGLARQLANTRGLADRIDWTVADTVLAARHGIARDVSKHAPAR